MVTVFQQRVYDACSRIPKGKVSTYKLIADYIGSKGFRAVGSALNKNPFAPKVPCHRVVSSTGALGGFAFGPKKKIALLRSEGVLVKDSTVQNFKSIVHTFK